MKNRYIKSIAIFSLILCSVLMIGCRGKTLSTADEENANVKSQTSSDDRSMTINEDGTIIANDMEVNM